jgi:hypothetical protein
MSVCLVPDIPDERVVRCIVYKMKRHGELYHPQAGTKMAGIGRTHVDDKLPKLIAYLGELLPAKLSEIGGESDLIKKLLFAVEIHRPEITPPSYVVT